MIIIEKIIDVNTNEETIIERDATDTEIEAREEIAARVATEESEARSRATAKAALLRQLGITEEQARLLLS
jgi:hypothetical protein